MMINLTPNILSCLFSVSWWLVIVVSVVDAYLLFLCRDVIGEYELNPAGKVLLMIANGGVWLFLLLKFLGTVLVCTCLLVMYRKNPRLGITIAMVIACFQFGLLIFLYCA